MVLININRWSNNTYLGLDVQLVLNQLKNSKRYYFIQMLFKSNIFSNYVIDQSQYCIFYLSYHTKVPSQYKEIPPSAYSLVWHLSYEYVNIVNHSGK